MELADYIRIIRQNLWYILAVPIIFGLITLVYTIRQPQTYQSSAAVEISRSQNQKQSDVPYYQYDNYYTVMAATTLADNMIGWLSSASTVAEIFNKAGYEVPKGNIKDLAKTFTVRKKIAASAVVDISYASQDKIKAQSLIKTAELVVKEKVDQYNKTDPSATFVTFTGEPVVIAAAKPTVLNTIIAVFVGLFLSLGIAFIKEAVSGKKAS